MTVNPWDVLEGLDDFTGSIGDWIANGSPSGPIGQAYQQRARDACDSWSNGAAWLTNLAAPGRAVMSNYCNPWLEANGSGDPGAVEGQDFAASGGARIRWTNQQLNQGPTSFTADVCSYRYGEPNNFNGFYPGHVELFQVVQRSDCSCDVIANPVPVLPGQVEVIGPTSYTSCRTGIDPTDDPAPIPIPNPNPRPDPGLDPSEEPYPDPVTGTPRLPGPTIPDPIFGEPVQYPDLPLPGFDDGESGSGYDPTVKPSPGPDIPGTSDPQGENPDTDFGEPPEGHIWVGFKVSLSNQDKTVVGFTPSSGEDVAYLSPAGGVYAILDFDGDRTVGPYGQLRNKDTFWVTPLPGLPLVGAKVHLRSPGVAFTVTPYSQPIEPTE